MGKFRMRTLFARTLQVYFLCGCKLVIVSIMCHSHFFFCQNSNAGQALCTSCPSNKYAPEEGLSECRPCPETHYSIIGADECTERLPCTENDVSVFHKECVDVCIFFLLHFCKSKHFFFNKTWMYPFLGLST